MRLLNLFVAVEDFCQALIGHQSRPVLGRAKRPGRQPSLAVSEVRTIIIYFHMSHYRDFKTYYTGYIHQHLHREFSNLVSYTRFVELLPTALWPLCLYLKTRFGPVTDLSFIDATIDATAIPVCHNRRIERHKVFNGLAARGKTSIGWFFGFKLHLVVNDCGDLLAFHVTPGNVDDRQLVPQLTQRLFGKLFGDKGYISQPLVHPSAQEAISEPTR